MGESDSENDGWPGLILDQYDTTRVLKLYTAAWLPRLDEMADLLKAEGRLVLRLSRNIQKQALDDFGLKDGRILHGAALDGPVLFLENGLRFEADVLRGQKTGFFLDQRENRRHVEALAQRRSVLNLFSYSGGFSLYAARGGAARVCSLDISEHALAAARRNFALKIISLATAVLLYFYVQQERNPMVPRVFEVTIAYEGNPPDVSIDVDQPQIRHLAAPQHIDGTQQQNGVSAQRTGCRVLALMPEQSADIAPLRAPRGGTVFRQSGFLDGAGACFFGPGR